MALKNFSVDHFGLLGTQVLRSVAERLNVPLPEATITEDSISESTLDALRTAAIRGVQLRGSGDVSYSDYPVEGNDLVSTYNYEDGWRGFFDQVKGIAKSATDPGTVAKTIVGKGDLYVDNNNNLIVVDDYNFDPQGETPGRLVDKIHKLFEPGNIFSVSGEGTRKTLVNLGTAPPDVASRLRGMGNVMPSPAQTIASTKTQDELYQASFLDGIYNSVEDIFQSTGKITTDDVPLEFIALAREKIANFFAANPQAETAGFVDMEMPDFENMPDIMTFFEAAPTEDGGFQIYDKLKTVMGDMAETSGNLLDIDIKLPAFDRLAGNIPDMNMNFFTSRPTLPKAILSDDRVEQMKTAIGKRLYSDNIDDMAFGEAFAKSRADGLDVFKWRGDSYTTQLAEEVDGN